MLCIFSGPVLSPKATAHAVRPRRLRIASESFETPMEMMNYDVNNAIDVVTSRRQNDDSWRLQPPNRIRSKLPLDGLGSRCPALYLMTHNLQSRTRRQHQPPGATRPIKRHRWPTWSTVHCRRLRTLSWQMTQCTYSGYTLSWQNGWNNAQYRSRFVLLMYCG